MFTLVTTLVQFMKQVLELVNVQLGSLSSIEYDDLVVNRELIHRAKLSRIIQRVK